MREGRTWPRAEWSSTGPLVQVQYQQQGVSEELHMSQVITATVENGVLRPDHPLELPAGTRVRFVLETLEPEQPGDVRDELDKLCDEYPIFSGERLTREQLHERR